MIGVQASLLEQTFAASAACSIIICAHKNCTIGKLFLTWSIGWREGQTKCKHYLVWLAIDGQTAAAPPMPSFPYVAALVPHSPNSAAAACSHHSHLVISQGPVHDPTGIRHTLVARGMRPVGILEGFLPVSPVRSCRTSFPEPPPGRPQASENAALGAHVPPKSRPGRRQGSPIRKHACCLGRMGLIWLANTTPRPKLG